MIKKHIPVLVVGLLIVLVALAGGTVYGINKLIPSRKQMDLTEYYGQNADGEAALILGTEKLEEKALLRRRCISSAGCSERIFESEILLG